MANKAKNNAKTVGKAKPSVVAKGVKFSFAGEYYTGAKNEGLQIKQYAIDIVFPEYTPKALSLFKSGLKKPESAIRKLMVSKYPDFRNVRTHTIVGVADLSGKTRSTNNVSIMSMEQLTAYIEDNDLNIDPNVYEGNITRLREAVILAEKDPDAFAEAYKADVEAYNFNKQLNDLNKDDETGTPANDTEDENDTEGEDDIDNLLGNMGDDTEGEDETVTDEG